MTDNQTTKPSDIVEWCARELEWMGRGHAAHETAVLIQGAARLREEADKIIKRAGGERV